MNEMRLVTEPSALIRRIARDALKGRWKDVALAVFIFLLLTSFIAALFDNIFPYYQTFEFGGQYFQYNASFVGSLYSLVLAGAFNYGIALFLLTFFRTKKTDNKLLFEGFAMIGKTILLNLVITLFTVLWTLLFIIPGIIAAIRYSQSFFILADHPEYTVMQCINESKTRMKGNVGKLFCLELSFFGWMFLAGLAAGGLAFTGGGFVGAVINSLISLIPEAFLMTYMLTATVVFYELLTGNLAVVNRSAQDEPIHMVNADYQVREEEPDDTPDAAPYVAPEERDRYNYAPKHEEDFGAPREDDFGSPRNEKDDF